MMDNPGTNYNGVRRIWCISLMVAGKLCPLYRRPVAELLFGTAAAESNFYWRRQIGYTDPIGPEPKGGFSLWQLEAASIAATLAHWRLNATAAKERVTLLSALKLDGSTLTSCTNATALPLLTLPSHDVYGAVFAFEHYARALETWPRTLPGQAIAWKQQYNTTRGKGTIDRYLLLWKIYCEKIVDHAEPEIKEV